MIISRTPLRISLVGGGTDMKYFYTKVPGKVISLSINKAYPNCSKSNISIYCPAFDLKFSNTLFTT